MARKSSSRDPKKKPHAHWDKVVLAAYLRILGATQVEAAISVGRSERTIQLWEADKELWEAAREEARKRWLRDVIDASRRSVLKAAGRNADLGFRILERIDPELAPRHKIEHTGKDGGPVEVAARVMIYIPDNGRGRSGS